MLGTVMALAPHRYGILGEEMQNGVENSSQQEGYQPCQAIPAQEAAGQWSDVLGPVGYSYWGDSYSRLIDGAGLPLVVMPAPWRNPIQATAWWRASADRAIHATLYRPPSPEGA